MTTESGSLWWQAGSVRAVTLYPWATMDVDAILGDLVDRNVNTVMVICKESDGRVFYDSDVVPNQVPERDLLAEITASANHFDLAVVPVFLTLCDKYLLERDPASVQVARDGTEIRYPNVSFEWMHWVCPSHESVREHLRALVEEISEYDVDGIRFQHLEFQPIRNDNSDHLSCFCEECLEAVEGNATDRRNREEWSTHRIDVTTELLASLAEPFDDDQMVNLQFEVFHDMDSTIQQSREQLGLDIERLAEHVDTLTPRTAHVDMDVHPLWIRDVTRSLQDAVDRDIVPSIRTASSVDPDDRLSEDELHTAIQMALHGGADGVSLFSAGANVGRLTDDQWDVVEKTFERLPNAEAR